MTQPDTLVRTGGRTVLVTDRSLADLGAVDTAAVDAVVIEGGAGVLHPDAGRAGAPLGQARRETLPGGAAVDWLARPLRPRDRAVLGMAVRRVAGVDAVAEGHASIRFEAAEPTAAVSRVRKLLAITRDPNGEAEGFPMRTLAARWSVQASPGGGVLTQQAVAVLTGRFESNVGGATRDLGVTYALRSLGSSVDRTASLGG